MIFTRCSRHDAAIRHDARETSLHMQRVACQLCHAHHTRALSVLSSELAVSYTVAQVTSTDLTLKTIDVNSLAHISDGSQLHMSTYF